MLKFLIKFGKKLARISNFRNYRIYRPSQSEAPSLGEKSSRVAISPTEVTPLVVRDLSEPVAVDLSFTLKPSDDEHFSLRRSQFADFSLRFSTQLLKPVICDSMLLRNGL